MRPYGGDGGLAVQTAWRNRRTLHERPLKRRGRAMRVIYGEIASLCVCHQYVETAR